jgi:putative ABC transport system substrate-binding protein
MRRRQFIAGLCAAAGSSVIWPVAARAQQSDRVRRIDVLMNGIETDPQQGALLAVFLQGLRSLG